jgi:hypothetical protein
MRIESPDPAAPGENNVTRPAAAVVGKPSRQGGNRFTAIPAMHTVVHDGVVTPWGNVLPVQVPARLSDVAPPAMEPTPAPTAIPVSLMTSAQRGAAAAFLPPRALQVNRPAPLVIEAEASERVAPGAAPAGTAAPAPGPARAHAAEPVQAVEPTQAVAPARIPAPAQASATPQAADSGPAPATGQTLARAAVSAPAPAAVRRARPGLADRLHTAWFELRRAVGWAGAVGVGLMLVGTALMVGLAPALQNRAEQLASDAVASREQRAQHRVEQLSAPSGAEVVQHFLDGFPPATQQVDDLAFLVHEAKVAGVQLARADYNLRAEPTLGLTYYQVNLPVQARYATLRRFTAGVLNARPNAALDELSLERKEGDEIQARVRFTFVYRSGNGQ